MFHIKNLLMEQKGFFTYKLMAKQKTKDQTKTLKGSLAWSSLETIFVDCAPFQWLQTKKIRKCDCSALVGNH